MKKKGASAWNDLLRWLHKHKQVDSRPQHEEMCAIAERFLGIPTGEGRARSRRKRIAAQAMGRGIPITEIGTPPPVKAKEPRRQSQAVDKFKRFYASAEWKRLRYDTLVASEGRCECCGVTAREGARLNVDHIQPLRKRWDLRLEPTNMQVLCGSCNAGKGNRHSHDWRRPKEFLDEEFERALACDE